MKLQAGWAFPDADHFMVAQLSPNGTYQHVHLETALRSVTHFGTAIDGGAHVGTWSRLLSVVFQQVIAVEPSLDTFDCLLFNMREHGCQNVSCQHVALGAAPGRVRMALDTENEARGNTGARHVAEGDDIPVRTIDSFALDDVGFIKLDIEGSELAAIRGAVETLKRCRPVVLVENKAMWTKHYGIPKEAVRDELTAQGYRLLETISCDQIWGRA